MICHPSAYWLAAIMLPGIGPRKLLQWLSCFSSIEHLFKASIEEWSAAGIPEKYFSRLKNPDWKTIEKELAWANESNHHLISIADSDYPALLKEIADPPLLMYVWGDKTILAHPQIAMVGARKATPIGLETAKQFAFELAEAGFVITSGLALGIDAASHRGALAATGRTIAVMGTGMSHLYPSANRVLAREIVEKGGAIISEFPLGVGPHSANFPRRNRIISGLSKGVLLVEAAIKSGSLITIRYAMEQNREVFAIPGSIYSALSRGCHHIIRQGAKLVETASDVLEELPAFENSPSPSSKKAQIDLFGEAKSALSRPLRRILDQIDYAITPIDVIVLRSGLTVGEVSSMLLSLTLDGYVQSVVGGYIRIASVN